MYTPQNLPRRDHLYWDPEGGSSPCMLVYPQCQPLRIMIVGDVENVYLNHPSGVGVKRANMRIKPLLEGDRERLGRLMYYTAKVSDPHQQASKERKQSPVYSSHLISSLMFYVCGYR